MSLFERIKNEIEYTAEKEGIYFPSNEEVTVHLKLTEEEEEEFLNITCGELVEAEHYEYDYSGEYLNVSYKYNE